ncbi:sensor histidine kinase [Aquihabitans sp. McL0605]|uniref:sensor histidine kinase n=1 Tax=Aquihabitans sp. McL0605 TaxID=3415671 RepID=UPI003CEF0BAC
MRRRIREAIVGVSAIILIALGIPLAIVVHQSVLDSEVVELQATAATALAEIDVPLSRAQLRAFASEPDAPEHFGVYGPDGRLLYGSGPAGADEVTKQALAGQPASSVEGAIIVASPIVETGSERVRGALRVTESLDGADKRARTAWLVMAVAGAAALGLAWVIGNRLSRVLSEPLTELAASAGAIGEVGTTVSRSSSGIAEIDDLAVVLDHRSQEVQQALLRERQFGDDVSHQLRTPITALRLKLEHAQAGDGSTDVEGALADLDRVEETIAHLLAVARDSIPQAAELRLDEAVASAVQRWQHAAGAAGRTAVALPADPATVLANRASVDEVLDVLIDNGLRHGAGTIEVSLRHLPGAVAVDVRDEGSSIATLDAERVFTRGHGSGSGSGIGLAVARSVAEAEGGRLFLTGNRPTTFSLILLVSGPGSAA